MSNDAMMRTPGYDASYDSNDVPKILKITYQNRTSGYLLIATFIFAKPSNYTCFVVRYALHTLPQAEFSKYSDN